MTETADRNDPDLWNEVKRAITAGAKGGEPGEWSARKAQMAVAEYKKRGGGYVGDKDPHNSLHAWSEEDWGTKSGRKSGDTKKGRQHSAQPGDVAAKTAPCRDHRTRAELYAEAKKRDIAGRSGMTKQELAEALSA